MLELERQKAKLTNLNARAEVHGDKHEPAADLHFEFATGNDVLALLDPALKSSLYRKPDAEGDQAELQMNEAGWLPKLRFPKMGAFKWELQLKDATLTIHASRSDIVLEESKADGFKLEAMDGGTVVVTFRVACHPDGGQVGRIFGMIQEEVEISLAPKPEEKPEGWPFPGEGHGAAGSTGIEGAKARDTTEAPA